MTSFPQCLCFAVRRCWLSFPLAYSRHQFCIGCCFGPHVLVLGKVYEDAEDAGGDVEGQGKARPLLSPFGHLGSRARGSWSPEYQVVLRAEEWVQHAAAVQHVKSPDIPLRVLVQPGEGRVAPLALNTPRQQQSQAETHTHTSHGQHCLQNMISFTLDT